MRPQPWYATNARNLLDARQQGVTPDKPVIVSLVGGTFDDFDALVLYARQDMPSERMDWRMLVDLEVWLWAGPQAALSWVVDTASRIAHCRPRLLLLRFEHGEEIHDLEVGCGMHRPRIADVPAEHTFCWLPLNRSCSEVGAKLRQALIAKHARWSRL